MTPFEWQPAHESLGDVLEDLVRLERTDTLEAQILRARVDLWAQDGEDPDVSTDSLLVDSDDLWTGLMRAADRVRSVGYVVGIVFAAGAVALLWLAFGSESGL